MSTIKIKFTKKTTKEIDVTEGMEINLQTLHIEVKNTQLKAKNKEKAISEIQFQTLDKLDQRWIDLKASLNDVKNKSFEIEFPEDSLIMEEEEPPQAASLQAGKEKETGASASVFASMKPEKELLVGVSLQGILTIKRYNSDKIKITPITEKETSKKPDTNGSQTPQGGNKDKKKQPDEPLPPKKDIDDKYNEDPQKQNIPNNPKFFTPEKREHAEQLLKDLNATELLVGENKYNQELLDKLLTEKNSNSEYYQELNQDERIDKAIKQLQAIAQPKTNNNNSQKGLQTYQKVLIGGGIFLVVAVIVTIILRSWHSKKRSETEKDL